METQHNFQTFTIIINLFEQQSSEKMLIADLIAIGLMMSGFAQQYMVFVKTKSVGQFNILITAILLAASLLKIGFYFIKPYAGMLLLQNFIMAFLSIVLCHKYVQLRPKPVYSGKQSFAQMFWNWPTFSQYVKFTLYFTAILAVVVYYSVVNQMVIIGETMASFATVIEIGSAVPQILTIFKNKSANGVSRGMVLIWLCSDSYKTIYFIAKEQPLQFILTGFCQAMLDITLISQMIIYRDAGKTKGDATVGENSQSAKVSSVKASTVSETTNSTGDAESDFSSTYGGQDSKKEVKVQ